jgi:epoxyqueuosine reductase
LRALDDAACRAIFAGSPIKRSGRDRFLRNVLIAAGNSGEAGLIEQCRAHLDDASPLVRGAAVWALSRLLDAREFAGLAAGRTVEESDPDVISEWNQALEAAGRIKSHA